VIGVLESPEVVVLEGAVVTSAMAAPVAAEPAEGGVAAPASTPGHVATRPREEEEEIFIPSPVHRQGTSLM
jgi:hypothetical protein